jgi:hypothetical protein
VLVDEHHDDHPGASEELADVGDDRGAGFGERNCRHPDRFQTTRGTARARLSAVGRPITPSPTKPTSSRLFPLAVRGQTSPIVVLLHI